MRCAVYARVSTEMETQKTSIAHQISFFEKYIGDKGWVLHEIYQDVESGRSIRNREGLQRLLEDSKKGAFQIILTKSISRFARNTLEGLEIIRDLKNQKIRFITIEDGFDSQEYDEFMFTLLLSIAQKESEKMSERIRFGKLCRAKNGYYNGSTPPYGYKRLDKHTIVPAEDVSTQVVREIFQLYLEGNGLYKIAKALNAKAYPTPSQQSGKSSGAIWHQSTIRKILSNSVYVGSMVQNKTITKNVLTGERDPNDYGEFVVVKDTHPGIIEQEVFDAVQQRLNKKKAKQTGSQGSLFSNLLLCGECGSTMHYKKGKDAYICGKVNKMGKKYCTGAYIHGELILQLLKDELEALQKVQLDKKSLLLELEEAFKKEGNPEALGKIEKQIHKAQQKKNKVLDLLLEEKIDRGVCIEKMNALEGEIEILRKQRDAMVKEKTEGWEEKYRQTERILAGEDMDVIFIHTLIHSIRVYRENRIEIYYNFKME